MFKAVADYNIKIAELTRKIAYNIDIIKRQLSCAKRTKKSRKAKDILAKN